MLKRFRRALETYRYYQQATLGEEPIEIAHTVMRRVIFTLYLDCKEAGVESAAIRLLGRYRDLPLD